MTYEQTISWIFLAAALATQIAPSDFRNIASIANGVNHSLPSHKELQSSITWLIQKGLVEKIGSKYMLTEKGKSEYEAVSKGLTNVFDIWNKLELRVAVL